jgi:glutaminase
LNKIDAVRPLRDAKPSGALAPVANYLAELHQRISSVVHLADTSARKLIVRAARAMAGGETELVFASMHDDGPLAPLARAFAEPENENLVRIFRDADAALEWCEDQLLATAHKARRERNSRCPRSICSRD